jgi:2-iminobutanoate/2-iminopropanoate deaminase
MQNENSDGLRIGTVSALLILLVASAIAAGCSVFGTEVESKRPSSWPQTPGRSAEETKAIREAEVGMYRDPKFAKDRDRPSPSGESSAPNASRESREPQTQQRGPAQQPTLVPDVARYGDLLFVSGQVPDANVMGPLGEPATIEEETRAVMEKIRAILETQNLNMANIVNTTIYLVDAGDIAAMEQVYDSYFRSARPASSIVEVRRLPRNARVQIAVVAGR